MRKDGVEDGLCGYESDDDRKQQKEEEEEEGTHFVLSLCLVFVTAHGCLRNDSNNNN